MFKFGDVVTPEEGYIAIYLGEAAHEGRWTGPPFASALGGIGWTFDEGDAVVIWLRIPNPVWEFAGEFLTLDEDPDWRLATEEETRCLPPIGS